MWHIYDKDVCVALPRPGPLWEISSFDTFTLKLLGLPFSINGNSLVVSAAARSYILEFLDPAFYIPLANSLHKKSLLILYINNIFLHPEDAPSSLWANQFPPQLKHYWLTWRFKVSPMWDGNGDGAKDEGDDREEKHRPRERGLVLRPTVAIAGDEQQRLETKDRLNKRTFCYCVSVFLCRHMVSMLYNLLSLHNVVDQGLDIAD